jgi:hypothetical protein
MHPNTLLCWTLASAIVSALTGCSGKGQTHIEAHTWAEMRASVEHMIATTQDLRAKRQLDHALTAYQKLYLASGNDPTLPPMGLVGKMSGAAFIDLVTELQTSQFVHPGGELNAPITFPNSFYTRAIRQQLQIEHDLLVAKLDALQEEGRNTIDQYPVIDVGFIPPNGDTLIHLDVARFLITLGNNSGFDAYTPEVRITLASATRQEPVYREVFTVGAAQDIFAAGTQRTFEVRCCAALGDPYNNDRLKHLPSDTQIEVEVLSVKDHANRVVASAKEFSIAQYARLLTTSACLASMDDLTDEAWIPKTDEARVECTGARPPRRPGA